MLDERENITVLAERANMPRGKAALVLKQAGIARDHYRLYPTKEALAALTAAVDQSRATGHQANMTDRIAMATVLDEGFDILVNNAAVIAPIGRILDISAEDWATNIDINLTSAFHATQRALAQMIANGGGTIVNISSGAAHRPQEGWSAYCAGKAGLAMLTRSVHLEYGPQGIRIFGFAPGVVDTDMQGAIRASGINPVSKIPRGDLAPAHEPARAIAWLCTPAADALAGQDLDVRNPELRAMAGLPALG